MAASRISALTFTNPARVSTVKSVCSAESASAIEMLKHARLWDVYPW